MSSFDIPSFASQHPIALVLIILASLYFLKSFLFSYSSSRTAGGGGSCGVDDVTTAEGDTYAQGLRAARMRQQAQYAEAVEKEKELKRIQQQQQEEKLLAKKRKEEGEGDDPTSSSTTTTTTTTGLLPTRKPKHPRDDDGREYFPLQGHGGIGGFRPQRCDRKKGG
eukprot:PhM_4_TR9099/c0_g1_i3/m.36821